MSDAKVEQTTTADINADVVQTTQTVSPTEQTAREQGWVTKEEWVDGGGNPDEWRSAKEFVDRGELYKSIHSTKRELKQTQAALNALQRHHQFVFDKAYQKAKDELKLEKRLAIREGDLERLEEVEDRIEALNEEHVKEKQQMVQQQAAVQADHAAEMDEFLARNPWYQTDSDLKDEADAIGFIYVNKGGKPEGLLKHVETQMRKKFPEKFGVKKTASSPVASGDRTVRTRNEEIELTDLETKIMKDLVKSGTMTEKEYKAELKKAKGIR